ncbi:hypothetical protein Tco_0462430 [Tanacetum coccineum]
MLTLSNAKHIYYCLPGTTLTRGIREIKTYSDMVEFMRIGYENDNRMELFTEHNGYDVLEYSHNDNLVGDHASDNEHSDDPDYEGESDPENIDFHTKGTRSDLIPPLSGNYNLEEDDPEDEIVDGMHKADKGDIAGGSTMGRCGGSVGRGGGSNSKRGGGSVGRGGGSNSKRGGGSTVGRGGGSVGRGGGSNNKRGGGVKSGGLKRGESNIMDTEFRLDQEAEGEVLKEVRATKE